MIRLTCSDTGEAVLVNPAHLVEVRDDPAGVVLVLDQLGAVRVEQSFAEVEALLAGSEEAA